MLYDRTYTFDDDLAWLSDCCILILSSLEGDGIKPTSQPSFTSLPIHQSLLYFCSGHSNNNIVKIH